MKKSVIVLFGIIGICFISIFMMTYSLPSIQHAEITTGGDAIRLTSKKENGEYNYVVTEKGYPWSSNTKLNIFKNPQFSGDRILAPGSSGSYYFQIENLSNLYLSFSIEFTDENLCQIPLEFRLRDDKQFLVGNNAKYVSMKELKNQVDTINLSRNKKLKLILDWKWDFMSDDSYDTFLGQLANQDEITYLLNLQFNVTEISNQGIPNFDWWLVFLILLIFSILFIIILLTRRQKKENEEVKRIR